MYCIHDANYILNFINIYEFVYAKLNVLVYYIISYSLQIFYVCVVFFSFYTGHIIHKRSGFTSIACSNLNFANPLKTFGQSVHLPKGNCCSSKYYKQCTFSICFFVYSFSMTKMTKNDFS